MQTSYVQRRAAGSHCAMHSPRTVLYRPVAGCEALIRAKLGSASSYRKHRRPSHRTQAAGSKHNANATAQVGQPPVLPQHDHVDIYQGQARRDEYNWIGEKRPTDPEILDYLKSENQYCIQSLAHTRDLQLKLQHDLQAWQQAQQQDTNASKVEQLQQSVGPDWLAGGGRLQYQQCKQFGYPGVVIGQYRFFSLPSNTSSPSSSSSSSASSSRSSTGGMMHCRTFVGVPTADAAAAAAAAVHSAGQSGNNGASNSASDHPTAESLPPNTVILWDETGCCCGSSNKLMSGRRSSCTHSLSVSLCGCYLAVTYSSSWLDSSRYDLAVINCSTGRVLLLPVSGVDGPILWVAPTPAAVNTATAVAGEAGNNAALSGGTWGSPGSHQQQQQQQQQFGPPHKQYLVYLADDHKEVHCLEIDAWVDVAGGNTTRSGKDVSEPGALVQPCAAAADNVAPAAAQIAAPAAEVAAPAAPAAPADMPVSAPRLIFRDPQHVSLNIAAAVGLTFITVYAADGLIRQVLYCTGDGGGLTPDQAEAWQVLLPAGTVARLLSAPAGSSADCCAGSAAGSSSSSSEVAAAVVSAGDDDPTCRLAVQCVDDLLLVRHSCSALPQGQLFLGRLPQQPAQQLADWQLLLAAQSDLILEAVFVCQEHSSSSSSTSSSTSSRGCSSVDKALQLVVLGWKPYNCAQHHQQQRQQLEAQRYRLKPRQHDPQQPQQQQQTQALLEYSCIVPIPDAFFEVHNASWHPRQFELQVEFSSFARPRSRLIVSLAPQVLGQHRVQDGLLHGAHNLHQAMEPTSDAVTTPDSTVDSNTDCGTDAAVPSGSQIEQLVLPPAGHNQSDHVTQQIGVPSLDHDVIVPVSVAYNKMKVQLPRELVDDDHHPQRRQHHENTSDVSLPDHSTEHPPSANPTAAAAARNPMRRMLLSCYGSYGIRECVAFSPEVLLLLDAGWLVAVAHVRGGGWCGRAWAEAGRGTGKINSVKDLLGVAHHMHKVGLVSHGGLCLQGASAGGWLAASVLLQQPQLFAAVVLTVPCLDPLGALLQHNQGELELGTAETDPEVYASIRSWAPYDLLEQALYPTAQKHSQLSEQPASVVPAGSATFLKEQQQLKHQTINSTQLSPHILIRAALGDQEVPISDPVKALARLRRWYSMHSHQQLLQEPDYSVLTKLQNLLPPSDDAAAGAESFCGNSITSAVADLTNRLLLLRVVPGGHTAFQASVRESALKVAFLMTTVDP